MRSRLVPAGAVIGSLLLTVALSAGAAPHDDDGAAVWRYLAAKYDANRDGRIEAGEYGRDTEAFDRLDQDGDGAVTIEDLQRSGSGMAARKRAMRGYLVIARCFQDDDDHASLTREEFERSFDHYDANDDDVLDGEEFRASADDRAVDLSLMAPAMMKVLMAGASPWRAIVEAVPSNDEHVLTRGEMIAFYEQMADDDGTWSLSMPGAGESGVPEGEIAPDFTLLPPDGGDPVTLSSFTDRNVPVALIFGSYT